jgi:LPXTG-site transpeptidase (sortase) family protein
MPRKPALGALVVACLLAASGCFAMAWRPAGHRHLVPYAVPPPASAGQLDASTGSWLGPPDRPVTAGRTSPPVRVAIPAIGLSAPVVPVGLDSAGHVQMPHPSVAGWYRPGNASAVRGPAVLVGHVDSDRGPAVFYRLSGVRLGETVRVVRADGSTSTYTIRRITVVAKTDFPSQAVFDPTARATIRLVTCGGAFDTDTSSYRDSLIVWGHATPS